MGEELSCDGHRWARLPEAQCDTIHAHDGVSLARHDAPLWEYQAILRTRFRNCTYLPAVYHTFLLHCVQCLLSHLITILGVETNNDNCKRNHLSCNRHCGPKEILIAEKRLEKMEVEGCQGKKRPYQF